VLELHDYDWRRAIRIVEVERQPGDALLFCPDWLRANFDDNGGDASGAVTAQDRSAYSSAPRVWAFVWSGAPESSGAGGVKQWLAARRPVDKLSTPIISLQVVENPPP